MKLVFEGRHYTAKYDQRSEMWNIYGDNVLVAKIYDDYGTVAFVDPDITFERDELRDLIDLSSTIQRQYTKLNP